MFVLYGNNIKEFVNPLIDLTAPEQKYPEVLFNLPPEDAGKKYSRGDFFNKVYSVLAAIAPYSEFLEGSQTQSFSQSKVNNLIIKSENLAVCLCGSTYLLLSMMS